jgi:hypothetical protein
VEPLQAERLAEAVRLVNTAHDGEDFFEPLTYETLTARAQWAPLFGEVCRGDLVAVAGLWDRGAATARVQRGPDGVESRSREATVTDWGFAPGCEAAFANLLRGLASAARDMGRDGLTICEPYPGAFPAGTLASRAGRIAVFTPGLEPPAEGDIKGIFIDMLYL